MAVKHEDKWYVDGRKEPFDIEARNGWYGHARIRPGYIIMREADYLKDRYLNPNVNKECNVFLEWVGSHILEFYSLYLAKVLFFFKNHIT